MEHLDTFLASQPPFDGLDPAELAALAAQAASGPSPPGEVVLVEDGAPATGLYVVCTGSMELVHEGELVVSARARASASATRRC